MYKILVIIHCNKLVNFKYYELLKILKIILIFWIINIILKISDVTFNNDLFFIFGFLKIREFIIG